MTTATATLPVEQRIIALESQISEARFLKRLSMLWLTAGNAALVCAVVAGNLFIDYSKPGLGRVMLNFFGVAALLVSSSGSIYWWNQHRSIIRNKTVELRQKEAEKRSLQAAEVSARSLSSTFRTYYESIPNVRDEFRRGAEKYRSRHNLFQLTVIIGSILTSVSTTAAAEQGIWSWIAVGISALVSISAGIIAYFKFRERSLNLQQTADSIDLEVQAYTLGIRRYKDVPPEVASALFAEEVERIREEQRKKELQLEQPPEVSHQRPQPA
ncbi:DUF4231 domain-containing protein [Streptomyces nigra]